MPENTIPTTSVFATKNTNASDVKKLIAAAVERATPDGRFPSELWGNPEFGEIGESRGWLIARRAWLEVNMPERLLEVPVIDWKNDEQVRKVGKMLSAHRDAHGTEGDSWGELMVMTGLSEGKCRKAWELATGQKSLGHRTGKGGQFAYRDPELYLEHRKAEGAHIPSDYVGKPPVEKLLNAKGKDGKIVRAQRAASPAKAAERKAERAKRVAS